jgi:branched-chain amino acid transport system substrate-binding protein
MKAMPTDDPLFGRGLIRADGRKIHPNYVLRTKTASASKERWDYFDVIATVPAEQSFRPIKDGNCPLVN